MTAAEIVPYGYQNAELVAEVERLRQQVAELEGAGGAYPDHGYDRQPCNGSLMSVVSFRNSEEILNLKLWAMGKPVQTCNAVLQ